MDERSGLYRIQQPEAPAKRAIPHLRAPLSEMP